MRFQSALACLLVLTAAAPALALPIAVQNAGFEAPYTTGNLPGSYAGIVPPGGFPVGGPPAGWAIWPSTGLPQPGINFVGVLNPGIFAVHGTTYFPAGAPEGLNVVLLYRNGQPAREPYGIEQQLTDLAEAGTRYTLSVQVGNIASGTAAPGSSPYDGFGCFELGGFPGYRVELWAGSEVLAVDDDALGATLPEGEFAETTLVADVPAGHSSIGQPLLIRLVTRNGPSTPGNGCPGGGTVGNEVDFDAVQLTAGPIPQPTVVPLPFMVAGLLAAWLGLRGAGAPRLKP